MNSAPSGWYKLKCDGTALGKPGNAVSDGVFRTTRGFVAGSFAMPLGIQSPLYTAVMHLYGQWN